MMVYDFRPSSLGWAGRDCDQPDRGIPKAPVQEGDFMSPTDPGPTPSPDEQQAPMQEEMVDHPDVRALVAQARDELANGNDKQAARLLTDAAYHTHDPELERQVRELAAQGLERAGRFGKGRWEEIIRIADLHAARANA
jgi:hypothetical protein